MEKVISIVGAGGKTTLVHKLAREYHRRGKGVLVTTTTHMYVEADTDLSCDFFALRDKIIKDGYCMDGAFLGSIDISIGKARTARLFNMPTSALGAASQPGKELYGIEVTNNGLVIFGGGELLKNKDGVIVGAVGVSGGSVAEDTNVAKAGVAAFK